MQTGNGLHRDWIWTVHEDLVWTGRVSDGPAMGDTSWGGTASARVGFVCFEPPRERVARLVENSSKPYPRSHDHESRAMDSTETGPGSRDGRGNKIGFYRRSRREGGDVPCASSHAMVSATTLGTPPHPSRHASRKDAPNTGMVGTGGSGGAGGCARRKPGRRLGSYETVNGITESKTDSGDSL